MGIIGKACSSCGAEDVALEVIGARAAPHTTDEIGYHFGSAAALCSRCNSPVAFTIVNERPTKYSAMVSLLTQLVSEPHSAESIGLQITWMSPAPRTPTIPAHVPPIVERLMLQAERNYRIEGNEEAAAVMYSRALENTLQDKFPELYGPLAARIEQLVAANVFPATMNDWAEETGVLGDDAARALDSVDRNQLRILRGFTNATLRQLYTLPADAKNIQS
jgi:hypothetical protein